MTGFLAQNWVFLAALAALFVMHRRGYGCGMHGHGQHDREHERITPTAPQDTTPCPLAPKAGEKAVQR